MTRRFSTSSSASGHAQFASLSRGLMYSSNRKPSSETASTTIVIAEPGRDHVPPGAGARCARAERVLEHRSPGDLGRIAEAEEGQGGLREDRHGDDQHRVGEDQRQRVGEDVGLDDVGVSGSQRPGPLDERALAKGQDLGADDPPGARPGRQADDRDQDDQRRVEDAGQNDHQRQRRDDQEPVLEGVEDAVRPATEVAAGEADDRAQNGRDQRPPRSRR